MCQWHTYANQPNRSDLTESADETRREVSRGLKAGMRNVKERRHIYESRREAFIRGGLGTGKGPV